MKELCNFCIKSDVCRYKRKREKINAEFFPFQMQCRFYQKQRAISIKDIETAPVLKNR